ncbi:MAG: hypothetical protein DCF25_02590 [Leptolyngbya foveolarum]|uniref:site-specific DNA-methyltransferase (adenine-specific) n=1 Tax=Leptolyngbya foveolarum TaxID=47253 RepID=A0A2W4UT68_9CYAN|nr:MAG: hypothetical protein DCF25_02590 [Leptolyngbya foveolarum]
MTLSPHSSSQAGSRAKLDPAETALSQHHLTTLFTQHLGWESLAQDDVNLTPLLKAQTQCVPIARKENVTAWKVHLAADTRLTSALREQLYSEIASSSHTASARPLVIVVDAENSRSLWCQATHRQDSIESVLYVSGQPISLWKFRLERLQRENAKPGQEKVSNLFRSSSVEAYLPFRALLEGLCEGITGISNITDCQNYAVLTLQRLILIQAIQQKGWTAEDTWYLQTQFGEVLQSQKNFFSNCLQPLYQCLALPKVERPLALGKQVGDVPFLGHFFHTHRLEQNYTNISIANQPFEQILGWLSEQTSTDGLNLWSCGDLSYCLEMYLASQYLSDETEEALWSPPSLASWISDRTLSQLLIDRTKAVSAPTNPTDINDLLFNADAKTCRYLIQDVLPKLRILDPACGSGGLLVGFYQQLTEIFSNLLGYSQQNQDVQLQIWQAELVENSDDSQNRPYRANLLQTIQKRILKNILYGVDVSMQAVESTTFQLSMHTVATAQQPQDIEPLVDLAFNVLVGNSLIGLIDVDPERFEKVSQVGDREVLQGSLLQPLLANSYQTILAEKNLAVEHYKSRNQMLAEANNIPNYARAALLKEDILRLDINAQQKLDQLLLDQMSQQLGIQYKAAQLTEKPQRRPLTLEDIDILQPFHWGYHFNPILERGGFDSVVCRPPQGDFKPTATEFLQKFRDLAEVKGVSVRSLKTSKQALAKGDPEIAGAWLFYQDQYAYVADYFYRSEQYTHQNPTVEGKTVRNRLARERLFVEQCFNLLAPGGIGAVVSTQKFSQQHKAQAVYDFLSKQATVKEFVPHASAETAVVTVWQKS